MTYQLLIPTEMNRADRLTIERGIPGIELMERAGKTLSDFVLDEYPKASRILIIAGTGNNGGDGFIAARHLAEAWRAVSVCIAGSTEKIKGDAARALDAMPASLLKSKLPDLSKVDLIVDAVFGAGLDRDVVGSAAKLIATINESARPVISVDLPSGIDGRTGQPSGIAVKADHTVTFFRKKPGHVLLPGRLHCGKVHVTQIGIEDDVFNDVRMEALVNTPDWWLGALPIPSPSDHKYSRGHTVVLSGPIEKAGATRLSAEAALRTGSGLVTIASPRNALQPHAAQITSVMLTRTDDLQEFDHLLEDQRLNCLVLGPGLPATQETCSIVLKALSRDRLTVLDAGALTAFKDRADDLFTKIRAKSSPTVLTPHEGEFTRLFDEDDLSQSKIQRTLRAARMSGAVVLFKGADTVVGHPDGRASVTTNAPSWLATAGSGDVLSGIIAGLLAQGMDSFDATSAASWLLGDAANRLGPPLISSDVEKGLRLSLAALFDQKMSEF